MLWLVPFGAAPALDRAAGRAPQRRLAPEAMARGALGAGPGPLARPRLALGTWGPKAWRGLGDLARPRPWGPGLLALEGARPWGPWPDGPRGPD